VLTKVATDQLLFTPIGISLFYGTLATLEGRPEETPQVPPGATAWSVDRLLWGMCCGCISAGLHRRGTSAHCCLC
jgi:hypothetical protein